MSDIRNFFVKQKPTVNANCTNNDTSNEASSFTPKTVTPPEMPCNNDKKNNLVSAPEELAPKKRKVTSEILHTWIERRPDGLYCKLCIKFGCSSSTSGGVWTIKPFLRYKDLNERAERHANSDSHKLAIEKQKTKDKDIHSVINLVKSAAANQQISDKDVMLKFFDAAYFLFKNEIAHTTNWEQLLQLISRTDFSGRVLSFISSRPLNATYTSSTTVTEIMQCISTVINKMCSKSLKNSIAKFGFFSLMADEGTNIKNEAVVSICVRYLHVDTESINEYFMCCESVESTTAANIASVITKQLESRDIDPSTICALSFDGASNFSGDCNGVQRVMRNKCCNNAVYIHCRSHRLQLCLQRAANNVKPIKRILSAVGQFYTLFSKSPKRLCILSSIQSTLNIPKLKPVEPSSTRWLSYEQSVSAILKIYPAVLVTLEQFHVDGGDLSSRAGGLLLELRKDSSIRFLCILNDLLRSVSRLSCLFQTASADLSIAIPSTKAVIEYLQNYQLNKCDVFDANKLISQCAEKGIHVEQDNFDSFSGALTKFMDVLVDDLKRRFNDESNAFMQSYKFFDPKLQDESLFPNISKVCELFPNILCCESLQEEVKLFRRWVCQFTAENKTGKDIMFALVYGSQSVVFPAFRKLAILYLLLPLGTATVERSFSTINRVLTQSRNRLLADHQDDLLRISIEGPKNLSEHLLNDVFNEWISHPRRL